MSRSPLRIAHRGMPRRALENTTPSFVEALAAGADGIELDVHATLDGVVVVHHDPVLAAGAEIAREPWSALSGVELAPGVHIPTLESVCELVGRRAELFVEIKGIGIERLVLHSLRQFEGTAAIHSFDHALIGRLADRGVAYRLGLLCEERVTDLADLMSQRGAQDLWPHYSVVTAGLVDEVHRAGGRVITWTVNDLQAARRLAELGVDGLCTDDVTLLPTAPEPSR